MTSAGPQAGPEFVEIPGSSCTYACRIKERSVDFRQRVQVMRDVGRPQGDSLGRLTKFFRIGNIYHSNAIEGNSLDIGETRLVVEEGLTISGKPLKDSLEAKNLAHTLDLLEQLCVSRSQPVRAVEVRQLNQAVRSGIDDRSAGRYRTTAVEISGSAFRAPSPEKVEPEMAGFRRMASTGDRPSRATGSRHSGCRCAHLVRCHPPVH
jgi:Fic family protein